MNRYYSNITEINILTFTKIPDYIKFMLLGLYTSACIYNINVNKLSLLCQNNGFPKNVLKNSTMACHFFHKPII